ncbi:MAG: transposase [Bryobacterales bacterium]|nr:transposase [Bryobacterales bacterium]
MTNPNDGELTGTIFSDSAYASEESARAVVESARWPQGVYCPKCGSLEKCWPIRPRSAESGRGARPGLWRCSLCRRQFTVTVGTALEDSKLPLRSVLRGLAHLCNHPRESGVHALREAMGTSHRTALAFETRVREIWEESATDGAGARESLSRARRKRSAFKWPLSPVSLLRVLLHTAKTKPF